jgi:hypothetical protein
MKKSIVLSIFTIALAFTLQSAFAQTAPAPSPLHSTPLVNTTPAPVTDPAATQQKKHSHHSHRSGPSSSATTGSQNN